MRKNILERNDVQISEEGKDAVSLKSGMELKKDSYFSHIAIEVPGENTSNEWCKPVIDEEYDKLN